MDDVVYGVVFDEDDGVYLSEVFEVKEDADARVLEKNTAVELGFQNSVFVRVEPIGRAKVDFDLLKKRKRLMEELDIESLEELSLQRIR